MKTPTRRVNPHRNIAITRSVLLPGMDVLVGRMRAHQCAAGYEVADKPKEWLVGYACKKCGTAFRAKVGRIQKNENIPIEEYLSSHDGRIAIGDINIKE